MMSIEELKAAFGILGKNVHHDLPVRDLFIIIAKTIKETRDSDNVLFGSIIDRMTKLESRIVELEGSLRAANIQLLYDLQGKNYVELDERLKKVEKRNTALPHWTDMPR